LRIEHAAGKRGRLAKKSGAQVPDRRTRIYFVENVARVGAEGKAIALVRSFRAAKRTATRAAHAYGTSGTASAFATRTRATGTTLATLLSLLRRRIDGFQLGAKADRFAQTQV